MRSQGSNEIKVVLVGSVNVGKTAIVSRFVHSTFNPRRETTIGASFMTKTVNIDGCNVRFQIWDTAGAEKYHSLTPMYYRSAQISILVYDTTSKASLIDAKRWADELKINGGDRSLLYLVGNKTDLDTEREVYAEEGAAVASEMGAQHSETSAKTGTGVTELFTKIAADVYGKSIKNEFDGEDDSSSVSELLAVKNKLNNDDFAGTRNGEEGEYMIEGSGKQKGKGCC